MKNPLSNNAIVRNLVINHNKFVELTQTNMNELHNKMKMLNNTLAYVMVKNEVLVRLLSSCNPPITNSEEFDKMVKDRLLKTIEEAQKSKEPKNEQENSESEIPFTNKS